MKSLGILFCTTQSIFKANKWENEFIDLITSQYIVPIKIHQTSKYFKKILFIKPEISNDSKILNSKVEVVKLS